MTFFDSDKLKIDTKRWNSKISWRLASQSSFITPNISVRPVGRNLTRHRKEQGHLNPPLRHCMFGCHGDRMFLWKFCNFLWVVSASLNEWNFSLGLTIGSCRRTNPWQIAEITANKTHLSHVGSERAVFSAVTRDKDVLTCRENLSPDKV